MIIFVESIHSASPAMSKMKLFLKLGKAGTTRLKEKRGAKNS
tara:strand:+ start:1071 stop:1196 length:126 start_codon:yes stop_codon:yes gene_type:complete